MSVAQKRVGNGRDRTAQAVRLPAKLQAAFARLAEKGIGKIPQWPRQARIGIDYAARVGIGDIATDEVADNLAWTFTVLGVLAKADLERGDPPANCDARDRAEKAGPDCAHAYSLLLTIRDCSEDWEHRGKAYPALPKPQLALLQAAAKGQRLGADKIGPVLAKAEELAGILSKDILHETSTQETSRRRRR
jgi:hypothetical protein